MSSWSCWEGLPQYVHFAFCSYVTNISYGLLHVPSFLIVWHLLDFVISFVYSFYAIDTISWFCFPNYFWNVVADDSSLFWLTGGSGDKAESISMQRVREGENVCTREAESKCTHSLLWSLHAHTHTLSHSLSLSLSLFYIISHHIIRTRARNAEALASVYTIG